jgi:hypothetical protein
MTGVWVEKEVFLAGRVIVKLLKYIVLFARICQNVAPVILLKYLSHVSPCFYGKHAVFSEPKAAPIPRPFVSRGLFFRRSG